MDLVMFALFNFPFAMKNLCEMSNQWFPTHLASLDTVRTRTQDSEFPSSVNLSSTLHLC